MIFNLVEITENNTLQVRYIDEVASELAEAMRYHRVPCYSTEDLSAAPGLVKDVAALFPYTEVYQDTLEPVNSTRPNGIHEEVSFIRIIDSERHHFCYQMTAHVVENGVEKFSEKKPVQVVRAFDDISKLPEKAQKVARLIFTDEVKTSVIAAEEALKQSQAAELAAKQKIFQDAIALEVAKQLKG